MELVARAQDALVGTPRHMAREWTCRAVPTMRRNWLFALFVLLAVALRIVVSLAYWPALELRADSYDYLRHVQPLSPGNFHPLGYPLFLAPLSVTRSLGVVVSVQHLMGIAMGVIVYLLALRLGARRWLAAIAALPALFDAYQLDLEQFILAETLTDLLLIGALAILLWRDKVGARRAAVVGLLLAYACIVRPGVVPVLAVAALYLLVRGRWRPLLACCAAAAVVLAGYGGWYAATYGRFGYSDFTGLWLYGRVAQFATCHYPMPRRLAQLCPPRPVSRRSDNPEYFADSRTSPINALPLGDRYQRNQLGERFAIDVIEHQPLAYAGTALADTWHYFTPGHWMNGDRIDMQRWMFPPAQFRPYPHSLHIAFANKGFGSRLIIAGQPRTSRAASPVPALIGPVRTYQSIFYTPGPLLLACLIGAFAVALGLARKRAGRRHARWAALVLAVSAFVAILSPSMLAQFSYRYGLPLLVLLPPAGAVAADIGLDAIMGRRQVGWRVRGGTGDEGVSHPADIAVPAMSRTGGAMNEAEDAPADEDASARETISGRARGNRAP